MVFELIVILLIFNEVENVFIVVDLIDKVFVGVVWEVIVVDDNFLDGIMEVVWVIVGCDLCVWVICWIGW